MKLPIILLTIIILSSCSVTKENPAAAKTGESVMIVTFVKESKKFPGKYRTYTRVGRLGYFGYLKRKMEVGDTIRAIKCDCKNDSTFFRIR